MLVTRCISAKLNLDTMDEGKVLFKLMGNGGFWPSLSSRCLLGLALPCSQVQTMGAQGSQPCRSGAVALLGSIKSRIALWYHQLLFFPFLSHSNSGALFPLQ